MIITLPLPPKELSPNARVHWAVKARAVKKYRNTAYMYAYLDVVDLHKRAAIQSATVTCRFLFKDNRRRDGDNLLASMKAAFDGLVDAGVFTDDSGLIHMPVEQSKDAENPRVEIHVEAKGEI